MSKALPKWFLERHEKCMEDAQQGTGICAIRAIKAIGAMVLVGMVLLPLMTWIVSLDIKSPVGIVLFVIVLVAFLSLMLLIQFRIGYFCILSLRNFLMNGQFG